MMYSACFLLRTSWVAKGLWNIVQGVDVCPIVVGNLANAGDTSSVEDDAGSSSSVAPVRVPPPTAEQSRWDGKYAQAHALLALSIKRAIIPHILSCKTSKDAWDVLATLYQARNEARVAYLRK